jgi:DNA-binding MurR/RpiR family transcriptional regulator
MEDLATPLASTEDILNQLVEVYDDLSPQLRRAARHLLDNPNEIGVSSMRALAHEADVHPNTLVRLARAVGFESYASFREPFRDSLRGSGEGFPDRARWLQSLAEGHSHGALFSQMAAANLTNVEHLFAGTSAEEIKAVADLIVTSRTTYVLGVGAAYSLAHNFWYVTRMALDKLVQLPRLGSLAADDLVKAGPEDVLLAMTFHPYRTDIVETARMAADRQMTVVAVTDSRSSPLALASDYTFVTPNSTPQFFPSLVATLAFLETLTAFIIADADRTVVANIDDFHRKRMEAGVYWKE